MPRKGNEDRGLFEKPAGSKVWWILWYDENGKRHREKVGSKSAARSAYQKRRDEVRRIRLGLLEPEEVRAKRQMTMKEMLEKYRARRKNLGEIKNQAEDERYTEYWKKQFGRLEVRQVTPEKIETWMERRKGDGVKPSTVNRALEHLRAIFSLAVRDRIAKSNPVKAVKLLRLNNEVHRYLHDDEEARLESAMSPEHFDLVLFALHTGLRQGEQFELAWKDVDRRNWLLKIPDPKSGEARHVRLNTKAQAVLKRQQKRFPDSPWVFPAPNMPQVHRVAKNFMRRTFRPALKKARIKDFTWHCLRHTFGSRLAIAGIDIYAIKNLMGHSTLRMTERYAHLSPDRLKSAVEVLVGT